MLEVSGLNGACGLPVSIQDTLLLLLLSIRVYSTQDIASPSCAAAICYRRGVKLNIAYDLSAYPASGR